MPFPGQHLLPPVHGALPVHLLVLCVGENEKLSFLDSLPGALAVVIGSILLAWLCLKLYDEPVRKYLTALFFKKKKSFQRETPVIQESGLPQ